MVRKEGEKLNALEIELLYNMVCSGYAQTTNSSNTLNGKEELFISSQTRPLGAEMAGLGICVDVLLFTACKREAELIGRACIHAFSLSLALSSILWGQIIFWSCASCPCWNGRGKWTCSCLKPAPDKVIMSYIMPHWDFFIMQSSREKKNGGMKHKQELKWEWDKWLQCYQPSCSILYHPSGLSHKSPAISADGLLWWSEKMHTEAICQFKLRGNIPPHIYKLECNSIKKIKSNKERKIILYILIFF